MAKENIGLCLIKYVLMFELNAAHFIVRLLTCLFDHALAQFVDQDYDQE